MACSASFAVAVNAVAADAANDFPGVGNERVNDMAISDVTTAIAAFNDTVSVLDQARQAMEARTAELAAAQAAKDAAVTAASDAEVASEAALTSLVQVSKDVGIDLQNIVTSRKNG